jgi:tetratricopeptide (TPR) repeat protein
MTRTGVLNKAALVVFALTLAGPTLASGRPGQASAARASGLTDQQWRADIDALAKNVAEKHRHPFETLARADFDKAVSALEDRVPGLSDSEIIVGMARLVAMLRDGHSRLTLPMPSGADAQSHTDTSAPRPGIAFHVLPFKLYLFKDGLRIIAAVKDHADLVGGKVVRIGKLEGPAALEAVRPAVHYDSEMWFKLLGPQFLSVPEILQACGVTESAAETPLAIEKEGRTTTVILGPLPSSGPAADWITPSKLTGTPLPLYLKNQDRTFWFEYLPGPKAMYAQVNSVADDVGETLAAFAARMVREAEDKGAEKIVLDLRLNGGGNNYLNRGLVLALVGSGRLNRYGRLFTIIGRNTFSAAVSLVSALERWTETIFVGEPTGNVPSMYGDSRRYRLPNSGLTVRLSSVYWRDAEVDERRTWVPADIAAELSWADYAAGRDPALEAALAYAVPASLADQLVERIKWGGLDSAAMHYYKYRNAPATAALRTDETLLALADFLLAEKRPDEALQILRRCVVEYPEATRCLLALGKRLVETGQGQAALEPLRKVMALEPANSEAAEWLKKAEKLAAEAKK